MVDSLLHPRDHTMDSAEREYPKAGKCVHGARGRGSETSQLRAVSIKVQWRDRDASNGVYLCLASESFRDHIINGSRTDPRNRRETRMAEDLEKSCKQSVPTHKPD